MDQIKIFEAVPTGVLEQFVNDWLKENARYITVKDVRFVCGEYGRHFVLVHYEKNLGEEFIDKFVKGE